MRVGAGIQRLPFAAGNPGCDDSIPLGLDRDPEASAALGGVTGPLLFQAVVRVVLEVVFTARNGDSGELAG